MPKICDKKVLWEMRPSITTANVYYWGGFYGNASQRASRSQRYVDEVANWMNRVTDCLKSNGIKDIKVEEDPDDTCVYMKKGDETIASFCIWSSRSNVYRKQNLRPIKTLLNKLPQIQSEEKLGEVDETIAEKIDDNTLINKDLKKNRGFLRKKNHNTGEMELLKYKNKKYVGVLDCNDNYCVTVVSKPKAKDLIKIYGEHMCNGDFLESVEKVLSEDDKAEVEKFCMQKLLE